MMGKKYYYLITSLPELHIQDKSLPYSDLAFREELQEFLDVGDMELVRALYYPFDIKNMADLICESDRPFDSHGNYDLEELKSGLQAPESLPSFMEEYIYANEATWSPASYHDIYNGLTNYFIEWTTQLNNPFLYKWYVFEHHLRNVLAGLNCRRFSRDIQTEVLGSDFEAEKIRRNKDRDFGLSKVIDNVDQIVTAYQEEGIALRESNIAQMRWDFVEELESDYRFSVENLMAHVIKIRLVERDILSSEVSDQERINSLLANMKQGHELKEEAV